MQNSVDCSEMAATIADIALNIGSRPEVQDIDGIVEHLKKDFPEFTRKEVVDALNEVGDSKKRTASDLAQKLSGLKREARTDQALTKTITDLEDAIATETLPPKKGKNVVEPPEAIAELRKLRDELKAALAKTEPALREKYQGQIDAAINKLIDLKSGKTTFAAPKEELASSPELRRMLFERDKARSDIRKYVESLKPKSVWSKIAEPINATRALITSFDMSAVFRQGGFITLGNPIRAARAVRPMLEAFASEQKAYEINKGIHERPNAPLYEKSKLYLTPADGVEALSHREEAFMSNWAEKIPLVRNSERAYRTFLNKLRADSFDTMAGTLAKNGEPTLDESKAIANFINVATGRGSLGNFEKAAVPLNTVFFSPRYFASRLQLLAGQPLYGGSSATRGMVAKEYGKFLLGLGTVYALGLAAGGHLEKDPRSSDFGKLRFGNVRLDPLAGISQLATFVSREASGSTKSSTTGEITAIRGKKVPFGGTTGMDVLSRFIRSKLAPPVGAAVDTIAGEDQSGQPVTPFSTATNLTVPLSMRDIYSAMQSEGVPKGAALGLVSLFGMGLQTYGKKRGQRAN